jgi:hypothetical protein
VDLKSIGTATVLASPTITLQHFGAEFAIRIRVYEKARPTIDARPLHWSEN